MKLIVGLGNPGEEYVDTPHNAGFRFVDSLREFLGWDTLHEVSSWTFDKYMMAEICKIKVQGDVRTILAKPQTFMNRSGMSVSKLIRDYEINDNKSFVLVHDDLDIKLGEFKIQRGTSPKGHKGVESVHNFVNKRDFLRIRLGIDGRDDRPIPGEDYVLMKYDKDQLVLLDETISEAIKMLRGMVEL